MRAIVFLEHQFAGLALLPRSKEIFDGYNFAGLEMNDQVLALALEPLHFRSGNIHNDDTWAIQRNGTAIKKHFIAI